MDILRRKLRFRRKDSDNLAASAGIVVALRRVDKPV